MAASASDEAVRLVSAAHEASRDGVVSILDKLTEFLIHRHPECLPALLHKVLELKVCSVPAPPPPAALTCGPGRRCTRLPR